MRPRGNLYDRIESRFAHALGSLVFGVTNAPDLLDSARETAARRLAPWLGDSADREERASEDAAFYRHHAGDLIAARDKAVADARRSAEALEQMAERLGEATTARDAWAARAEAAEAQRDGARVAITAALALLEKASMQHVDPRIFGARDALRSVMWADPDAAEAEEPRPHLVCAAVAPDGIDAAGLPCQRADGHVEPEHEAYDERGRLHRWPVVSPPVDPSRVVFAADLLHDPIPDTPVPVALTCAGAEACERAEEIARLTAERDRAQAGWDEQRREGNRIAGEREALAAGIRHWWQTGVFADPTLRLVGINPEDGK